MRALLFIAALLTLLAVSGAQAQKGVLLPSCEQGSEGCESGSSLGLLPNLGRAPSAPVKPADQPQAEPAEKPSGLSWWPFQPKPKTEQPVAAPIPSAPPVITNISPGGSTAKDYKTKEEAVQALAAQYKIPLPSASPALTDPRLIEYRKKVEQRQIRKPIILNDPDLLRNPAADEKSTKDYPGQYSFAVSGSYTWGRKDIKTVQDALGYNAQEIPKYCQLLVKANLKTDKGTYGGKAFSGQRSVIRFVGSSQSAVFSSFAVCRPPSGNLPQKGKIIYRMGNVLSVQLAAKIACAPIATGSTSAEIRYTGDGKGECSHR